MAMRKLSGSVLCAVSVVIPRSTLLKAVGAAATPGLDPTTSAAPHTPSTSLALLAVANPCSSRAVTSTVRLRLPCTVHPVQAVWPAAQISPVHHPPDAGGAGAVSVPSPLVAQVLAALSTGNWYGASKYGYPHVSTRLSRLHVTLSPEGVTVDAV